jgi:hypothetical protein
MNQKLDVARVFERIFDIYRDQFTLLVGAALVLFLPISILNGIVYSGDTSLLGVLLVLALGTVATYWFQGMVVEAAKDILDGRRDHTIGSLVRSATPVILPLFLAGVLVGIAFLIGFVLLIVPGLIVLTFTAVVAPVIVVERAGVIDAVRRSIDLVRGHALQVFGVILVIFLLKFIVGAVIQAIANGVSDSFVSYSLADLIGQLIVAPLSALAAAVVFFELKAMRGEPVVDASRGGPLPPAQPAGGPAPTPAEAPPGPDRPA